MPRIDKAQNFRRVVEGDKWEEMAKGFSTESTDDAGRQQSSPQRGVPSDFYKQLENFLQMPKYTLEDVILSTKTRNQVEAILAEMRYQRLIFDEWGMADKHKLDRSLSINFSGPPGTGKTITAFALAQKLGKKILEVPYQLLESKYVGETPKNIADAFEFATKHDAVLFFDEADSFLGKRLETVSQSTDTAVNLTRSVMITQLSSYAGVVIFATNLIRNYDQAFISRIRWKVQFHLPDESERACIWHAQIPEALPLGESVDFAELAKKFEGISGRDIKNAVFRAVVEAARQDVHDDDKQVMQEHFIQSAVEIIEANKEAAQNTFRAVPVDKEVQLPERGSGGNANGEADASP